MNFLKLNEIDQNLLLRLSLAFIGVAIVIMSFDALASGDPVGTALCKVIGVFQGNTAKGIAIVGIITLGIQTLRGKLQWEVALVIVVAIIILFKAPQIVEMVSESTVTECAS